MALAPEAVLKDLKNGQYAPVYFLQGEEPFYIDQISDYIEEHALEAGQKGFNQVVMYGKDHPVNAIVTNARRFPMMSERQVVIVKEAQNIPDLNKEAGQKLLLDYIQNPLPSTILVICHKYKSIDKRKALGKQLDKHTVLVSTKKLYDNQVPDWVSNYIQSKGFSIDPKGTQMFADYIGNDLERLSNEIDKVLSNFEQKVTINADIIQKYVGISKEYNVFELQKALQTKDVLKANRIVNYFGSNPKKNPIIPIIAMLFGFYSKLLLVHTAKDKSQGSLASVLRINPFFVKDYLMAVRAYNLSQTINCIHHIKEADLRSKGVGFNHAEGELLKELVFKLIH